MRLPIVTSESCPKGTMFIFPEVLAQRRPGETWDAWAERILSAAKRGRVIAITNVAIANSNQD